MSLVIVHWQVCSEREDGSIEVIVTCDTRAEADAELRREKAFWPGAFLAKTTWEQVTQPAPKLTVVK
jgi:hypothetical protein